MQAIKIRVAAVIEKDGKFLCVKIKQKDREFWILPGGTLEYGESLSECIIRELKEETRLNIIPQKIIYMRDLMGKNDHSVEIFFFATIAGGEIELGEDPGAEHHQLADVQWMSIEELAKVTFFPPEIKPTLSKIKNLKKAPDCEYAGKHTY